MARSRRILGTGCLALLACFVMTVSSVAAPYEIYFHSGTITPEPGRFDLQTALDNGSNGRAHVLVQLNDYLHRGQREALTAAGIELLAYLPDRAYIAAVGSGAEAATLAALGVRHVSALPAEYKMHPRVMEYRFGSWSEYTAGRRIYAVSVMPDVPLAEAQIALEQAGCEVGDWLEAAHTVLAAFTPDQAAAIATLDAVMFLDETPPPMDTVNDVVRQRLHVNEVQAAPYNLSGIGVTGLVYDGGMVDASHPDFGNRVSNVETGTAADHSTHVAGTFGGDGTNSNGNYRGMAPDVNIISGKYDDCVPYCLYESPNDFEDDYSAARTQFNIELTTNSIGANIDPNQYPCEWMGDYETTSRLLDRLTANCGGNPLTMFFAAGNERNGGNCFLSQFSCMSVPAGAKNIITVGALTGTDAEASFSSWGPTDDGRVKPEVCATGVGVTSTVIGGGYASYDGTSMATPATAGVGALILQQWHTLFPNAPDPLPETMKAILINSATDRGNAGPDFKTGYGVVNALKAIQNLNLGGVLESALEIDEQFSYTFNVPDTLTALDISLAWCDIPATGNVIPALVNDLDLRLVDPNGTTHRPWVLRAASPNQPATTGRDSVNVCERVHVADPVAGEWTLHVNGTLNGSQSQTFGLAANVTLVSEWAFIGGQIRNSENNQGIPGRVTVIGQSQAVTTDQAGNYDFAVPADATYIIEAVSYGFAPTDSMVTVSTGNVQLHFPLRAAQNGTLNGQVVNQFGGPMAGAVVNFLFPHATIAAETTDTEGEFTLTLPGANTYEVIADYLGTEGRAMAFVPENGNGNVTVTIVDQRFAPAGPDGYGYRAYEITDPGSPATYNWMEISPAAGGPGTAITPGTGNDWTFDVTCPFPVRFYGQENTILRVSADGWVGVGAVAHNNRRYVNQPIPTDTIPNGIICVFWDDLRPAPSPGEGDLSYYHDTANGRFIIEYHNVSHYNPTTNHITAQLVIYNQTVRPTVTGDNEFELLYNQIDYEGGNPEQDADATIGIEDYEGDDGIEIVYSGEYEEHTSLITAGTALRFTTGAMGYVGGQIVTIPTVADITQATLVFGPYTAQPNADGSYLVDSVVAGAYELTVTLPGYESGHTEVLVVVANDTTWLDYELYRLDPPRNLAGQYIEAESEIHLNWDWPLWHDGSANLGGRRGGTPLDEHNGFDVMQSGVRVGNTSDTFFVYDVTQGGSYDFTIKAVYEGGRSDTSNHYRVTIGSSADPVNELPTTYYLRQNYPNPFNPQTTIEYGLPQASRVKIEVFDVLGRTAAVLADGMRPAGVHLVRFDGRGLASGVYYCRMQSTGFTKIQKMLLMK